MGSENVFDPRGLGMGVSTRWIFVPAVRLENLAIYNWILDNVQMNQENCFKKSIKKKLKKLKTLHRVFGRSVYLQSYLHHNMRSEKKTLTTKWMLVQKKLTTRENWVFRKTCSPYAITIIFLHIILCKIWVVLNFQERFVGPNDLDTSNRPTFCKMILWNAS